MQTFESASSSLVALTPAVSLGITLVDTTKVVPATLQLKSLSDQELNAQLVFEGSAGLTLIDSKEIILGARATTTLNIKFKLDSRAQTERIAEHDGFLLLKQNGQEIYRIPVLALFQKQSKVQATGLKVLASKEKEVMTI